MVYLFKDKIKEGMKKAQNKKYILISEYLHIYKT